MSTLPFLRALNPGSNKSGVQYSLWSEFHSGKEMMDQPFSDYMRECLARTDPNFAQRIIDTFEILMGNHAGFGSWHGRKGALDYFIFPLIARKLIGDSLERGSKTPMCNLASIAVAIPLEIVRFAVALSLTIALSPFVAIMHWSKILADKCCSEPSPASYTM